jgi:hypothetical protein
MSLLRYVFLFSLIFTAHGFSNGTKQGTQVCLPDWDDQKKKFVTRCETIYLPTGTAKSTGQKQP